jgi:hypothetical protein
MSCYTRHLNEFLPDRPASQDRIALDQAVRATLGMTDADCPEVWATAKQRREDPSFTSAVRVAVEEHR